MGPRSIDRGILSTNAAVIRLGLLQWGRDQLIAEFPGFDVPKLQAALLQWGRDQLIAELPWKVPIPGLPKSFNGAAIN